MQTAKIVVSAPLHAGKKQIIQTIGEIDEVSSECTPTSYTYVPTPHIAANKQDIKDTYSMEDMPITLWEPSDINLLPCVVTVKNMVKKVFLELLYSVLAVNEAGKS
jgi:signal recognition particle receptor subunit beta